MMIAVCGCAQGRQVTAMDPGKTNTMKVGDTFSLSGHVHSSVGYEFNVEYDKEAFSAATWKKKPFTISV